VGLLGPFGTFVLMAVLGLSDEMDMEKTLSALKRTLAKEKGHQLAKQWETEKATGMCILGVGIMPYEYHQENSSQIWIHLWAYKATDRWFLMSLVQKQAYLVGLLLGLV